jgi:hypothetical protein
VPLPPRVLEVPDQLLLLGVHRDDRLPGLQGRLDLGVDIGKLGIPIRVARALQCLAVGLEAVAKVVEQCGNHAMAGRVPQAAEFLRQLPHTLARPAQRRLGVAPGHRVDQPLQVVLEGTIGLHGPLPTASRAADAVGRDGLGGM